VHAAPLRSLVAPPRDGRPLLLSASFPAAGGWATARAEAQQGRAGAGGAEATGGEECEVGYSGGGSSLREGAEVKAATIRAGGQSIN